jgi:hypothetical protein
MTATIPSRRRRSVFIREAKDGVSIFIPYCGFDEVNGAIREPPRIGGARTFRRRECANAAGSAWGRFSAEGIIPIAE